MTNSAAPVGLHQLPAERFTADQRMAGGIGFNELDEAVTGHRASLPNR
jgi:hypothetical protein